MMLPEISVVRLNVQLTKKCNQRCVSCNSYELPSDDELSLDEFESSSSRVSIAFLSHIMVSERMMHLRDCLGAKLACGRQSRRLHVCANHIHIYM